MAKDNSDVTNHFQHMIALCKSIKTVLDCKLQVLQLCSTDDINNKTGLSLPKAYSLMIKMERSTFYY